jgi:4-diphosphocytidyl-2-C-methyl-D-erythritol kinase
MATRIRSFSKINLGLAIGPVREDGFHELATLYQTIAAYDEVTVAAEPLRMGGPNQIVLSSNDRRVPLDGRNTVWKMLERTLALTPFRERGWAVRVHIQKHLPMQGGLGAGSANAAAALIALERESGLTMPGAERLRVAAAVGSDVPLFLIGGAVLGLGRGEQVYPMPDLAAESESPGLESIQVVLALPGMGVSTPQAFRDWDALAAGAAGGAAAGARSALTPPGTSGRLEELSRALAAALSEPQTSSGVLAANAQEDLARQPLAALVRTGIRNDFEEVVFRQHPFLGTIKRALVGPDHASGGSYSSVGESAPELFGHAGGALYAALSGSGSALFGLYRDASAAGEAESRLQAIHVRSLRSRFLSRAAYWRQMHTTEGIGGTD